MGVEREPTEAFFQFNGLLLSVEVLQLYFLHHFLRQKRNFISSLKVSLTNMDKSFNDECISVFFGVFAKNIADECIQVGTDFFAKFNFFFNFFANSCVIFFVEVEVSVHKKLNYLKSIHIEVLAVPD